MEEPHEIGGRRLVLLRGSPEKTTSAARALLDAFAADEVLWAGGRHASRREVERLLGRSFAACVLDLHDRLDADLLGQCHGFVRGGGVMVVCLGEVAPPQPYLVAEGFAPDDVSTHFYDRLVRVFSAHDTGCAAARPSTFEPRGTADQADVVDAIARAISAHKSVVVTADRGRGKSAALGVALHHIDGPILVTAASEDAVREVFAFAPDDAQIEFVEPANLVETRREASVVIVDEAAQLPVALLQELTLQLPTTPIVFATTTHGYEGTGRGFTLRFVEWLRRQPHPLVELELHEPIRWGVGDPVEHAVFDALLLDAEPAEPDASTFTHREVTREELASDEALLREVFGLLVQAHYRTTPSDLHRMLDAPNLAVHASFGDGHVAAATLVALEGGLSQSLCDVLADGSRRVIGHALPETFAAHLGYASAAALTMVRSVRIAVHPALRRRGVASELVAHVHRSYDVDLFGTLFGATADLLMFRRRVGYELVRLSASRSRRTGVPSVAMIRPVSEAAAQLLDELRVDLARDLPTQIELFSRDGVLRLDRDLEAALRAGLSEPMPLTQPRRVEIARHYTDGPRTFEAAAVALRELIVELDLDAIDPTERSLIELRVIAGEPWSACAGATGLSVPAAMRALRRAVRTALRPLLLGS